MAIKRKKKMTARERQLAKNIEECAFDFRPKTDDEIGDAIGEFHDKIWYNRKWMMFENIESSKEKIDKKILAQVKKEMRHMEKKYGGKENMIWDDFDWGMLNGKLSALRWVIGYEWDMLDT